MNKVEYLNNYDMDKWDELKPQSHLDACFDIRAAIADTVIVPSYLKTGCCCTIIPNGFKVDLDPVYELIIRPRSGLAIKHGVTLTNNIGTIDAGYHNEVCTCLINFGDTPYIIKPGDRISQGALRKCRYHHSFKTGCLERVKSITKTGKDGFGSSGRN